MKHPIGFHFYIKKIPVAITYIKRKLFGVPSLFLRVKSFLKPKSEKATVF